MPKTRHVLTKVYDLCRTRGFVFEGSGHDLSSGKGLSLLNYGPLGVEIKRNLQREWWQEMVTSRENVYGIELSRPVSSLGNEGNDDEAVRDSEYISSYLTDTLGIAVNINPTNESSFGLAQHLCIHQKNTSIDKFMFNLERKEFYKLCFFCPTKKVSYWMDYWMRKRLSWWKKYSDVPAEFSLVDGDCRQEFIQYKGTAVSDTMMVQFNFPWGPEALECISSYSDVKKLVQGSSPWNANLGVVIVTMSAERGILAYLLDAYHERKLIDPDGSATKHATLRLHPALAPVKVAILSHNTASTDLVRVAQQLTRELRQAGINSHHFAADGISNDLEKYTLDEDAIGTLYTVTVADSTLTNGIVMLRNRDTSLSEFLHVSEILKTVQQHLDTF